jgi:hypothetical protein
MSAEQGSLRRILMVFNFICFIISGPSLSWAQWQIGDLFFEVAEDDLPLQEILTSIHRRRSLQYLLKVGGVNFGETAVPSRALRGKSIQLDYRSGRTDGERLAVIIDGSTYYPYIPDWQLKPIALFANSQYTAAVTWYGLGKKMFDYHYVQFHPSFRDTLLGVRILHADMVLMAPKDYQKLPLWKGIRIRGEGESYFDQPPEYSLPLESFMRNYIGSWLLDDVGTEPTFFIHSDKLYIHANPFYYFWRLYKRTNQDEKIRAKIERDKHIAQLQYLQNEGPPFLTSQYYATVNRINYLESIITGVIELREKTNDLRQRRNMLEKYNPDIYNAILQTSKFSSFFRYVQKNNYSNWENFLRKISNINIYPRVETPARYKLPEEERAYRVMKYFGKLLEMYNESLR